MSSNGHHPAQQAVLDFVDQQVQEVRESGVKAASWDPAPEPSDGWDAAELRNRMALERFAAYVGQLPSADPRFRLLDELQLPPAERDADFGWGSEAYAVLSNLGIQGQPQRNSSIVLDQFVSGAAASLVDMMEFWNQAPPTERRSEWLRAATSPEFSEPCRVIAWSALLEDLTDEREASVARLHEDGFPSKVIAQLVGMDRSSVWQAVSGGRGNRD